MDRQDRQDRPDRAERGPRPFRGGYRGDHGFRERGSDSPAHKSISSGGNTPSGKDRHSVSGSSSKFLDPWISILRIGEGKTAARMESTYKELASVNKTISELQAETLKLSSLLATLEVYGKRDSLSVEISNEKLDEFTYL